MKRPKVETVKADPALWVNKWNLGPISPSRRLRIRYGLRRAHKELLGQCIRGDEQVEKFQRAALEIIASNLFAEGLLTWELLQGEIQEMVSDACESAMIKREPVTEIPTFLGVSGDLGIKRNVGNYYLFIYEIVTIHGALHADILCWEGQLLIARAGSK